MNFKIIRILFWINRVIRFSVLETVRMLRHRCVVHKICMVFMELWRAKKILLILTVQIQQSLVLKRAPAWGISMIIAFPSRIVSDPCHMFVNSSAFYALIKAEICLLTHPRWNGSWKEVLAGILVLSFFSKNIFAVEYVMNVNPSIRIMAF